MAPAKRRKGNMTSINNTLKSNCSVSEVANFKKSGAIKPVNRTPADKTIARTIRPIVCGSFSIRRFIIEKIEANKSNRVASSRKFI
jgi:hypothetical protein